MAGAEFGGSYVLSLYKGFHWNFEDVVPERPEELLLEVSGGGRAPEAQRRGPRKAPGRLQEGLRTAFGRHREGPRRS